MNQPRAFRHKKLLLSFGVVIAIGGVFFFGIQYIQKAPTAQQLVSDHGTITLTLPNTYLKDNSQLAGTFAAEKDHSLLYTLEVDKKIISAGAIAVTDKTFSRNAPFQSETPTNATGTLRLQSFDAKGKEVDSLETAVRIQ